MYLAEFEKLCPKVLRVRTLISQVIARMFIMQDEFSS